MIFLSFTGVLIEWTGVVFNFLMSCYLYFSHVRRNRKLAALIGISTLLALSIIVVHYVLALGVKPYFATIFARFLSRTVSSRFSGFDPPLFLFMGYLRSYGPFILSLVTGFVYLFIFKWTRIKDIPVEKIHKVKSILLISSMPLLENLILIQHASQFSFDRLKAIFPMSILIGLIFISFANKINRYFFCTLIALSSIVSLSLYYGQLHNVSAKAWSGYHNWNQSLASQLSSQVDLNCASLSSNIVVRGYANLLFHRAIYEAVPTPEVASEIMKNTNSCASIYLEGFNFASDMPVYNKAYISFPDGSQKIILYPSQVH